MPGRSPVPDLRKRIKSGDGMVTLRTVSGGTLTLRMNGKENIRFRDQKSYVANLTISNVLQSNGIIQSIDTALLRNELFHKERASFADATFC